MLPAPCVLPDMTPQLTLFPSLAGLSAAAVPGPPSRRAVPGRSERAWRHIRETDALRRAAQAYRGAVADLVHFLDSCDAKVRRGRLAHCECGRCPRCEMWHSGETPLDCKTSVPSLLHPSEWCARCTLRGAVQVGEAIGLWRLREAVAPVLALWPPCSAYEDAERGDDAPARRDKEPCGCKPCRIRRAWRRFERLRHGLEPEPVRLRNVLGAPCPRCGELLLGKNAEVDSRGLIRCRSCHLTRNSFDWLRRRQPKRLPGRCMSGLHAMSPDERRRHRCARCRRSWRAAARELHARASRAMRAGAN